MLALTVALEWAVNMEQIVRVDIVTNGTTSALTVAMGPAVVLLRTV